MRRTLSFLLVYCIVTLVVGCKSSSEEDDVTPASQLDQIGVDSTRNLDDLIRDNARIAPDAPISADTAELLNDTSPADTAELLNDTSPADNSPLDVPADDLPPDPEITPQPGEPWKLLVVPGSRIIAPAIDPIDNSITIACIPVDLNGIPLEVPADVQVMVEPMGGIEVKDGRYHFKAEDEYEITCSSASLDLQGQTTVTVVPPIFSKHYVMAGHRLGKLHTIMIHLAKAAATEDTGSYPDIATQLQQLADDCQPEKLAAKSLFIPWPNGYPTPEEMLDDGIEAEVDDDQFGQLLEQTSQKMTEVLGLLEQLQIDFEDEALHQQLLALQTEYAQLSGQLAVLEPSAIAVMANLEALAQTSGSQIDAHTRQVALTLKTALDKERFSLIELVTSIAINQILTTIYSCGGLMDDAAKASRVCHIMMELFDELAAVPISPNPPVVWAVFGPGAGAIVPTLKWKIEGAGFDWDPAMNQVIFIPPEYGVALEEDESFWSLLDALMTLTQMAHRPPGSHYPRHRVRCPHGQYHRRRRRCPRPHLHLQDCTDSIQRGR